MTTSSVWSLKNTTCIQTHCMFMNNNNNNNPFWRSDLDDVVGGVFVIWGDVQANQDALTVLVPHLCQCLQEVPLTCRPLILPSKPIPHNRPPKLQLFKCFQHRFGVHLLQCSYVSRHTTIKNSICFYVLFD